MRMEELQTGFFGYRKESVYQLIASMEENFSSKLMEKDAQHTKAMQDAQIKIAELETELRTVRAEPLSSRKDQDMISDTLLDAQAYAQKLRAESISQEQQLRGQLQEEAQRQRAQLEDYARQLGQLHSAILTLLREMEERTQTMEEQVAAAVEQAPEPELNLSLFLKKTGTEE